MTDFNINLPVNHATAPKYRLFQNPTQTGGAAPAYGNDRLNLGAPAGGAAGTDPALLAQTEQLMQSPNPRDRYQAIVNLTKMNPADALPRLQAIAGAPGQDPNVVQLANEALRVMSQMAQQPGQTPGQSPVAPGQQPQQQPQQWPANQPPQQQAWPTQPVQQQPQPAAYNPGVGAPTDPNDAAFMLQVLQTDVPKGGDISVNAIRQIAAIAQQHPSQKEAAFNILLNHVYHGLGESVTEALRALGAMNDPRLAPYLQMVQRDPKYHHTTRELAVQLIQQNAQQSAGAPGAASVGGNYTVEYVRSAEFELAKGGPTGMAALAKIQAALGPDPRAQGPMRQEVIRVLVTHLATGLGSSVAGAAQMLGAMGAREMDTLRYLDAVQRNPSHSNEARDAARAAIRQIMSTPAQ